MRIRIIFYLSLITQLAFGQPVNKNISEVVPLTPEGAALVQYIDTPIDMVTGTPSINIPIHTVVEGTLRADVSISYHGSGIRAAQSASRVGLGFTLIGGGMVSRQVQGLPDDKANGYYRSYNTNLNQFDGQSFSSITDCTGGSGSGYIADIADGSEDGESDIYSFTVPGGYSGKFVIDKNKKAQLINRQDIKIQIVADASVFQQFIITTPDGAKHYFGNSKTGTENIVDIHSPGTTNAYRSNWHLIESISYDGLHDISYEYEEDDYNLKSPRTCILQTVYYNISGSSGTYPANNCSGDALTSYYNGYRLSKIQSSTDEVTIVSTTAREDLVGSHQVDRIEIETGAGDYCKKFDFSYSYFKEGSSSTLSADKKKLKLDEIQERACIGSTDVVEPYIFDYYGTIQSDQSIKVPGLLSLQTDHWGYYNGQSGNDSQNGNPNTVPNIPPTTLYTCISGDPVTWGNSNRDVDTALVKSGTIKSMTLPTGGKKHYVFECHTAQEYSSQTNTNTKLQIASCGTLGSACCGNLTQTDTVSFTYVETSGPIKFDFELQKVTNYACPPGGSFTATGKVTAFLGSQELDHLEFNLSTSQSFHEVLNQDITELIGYNNLYPDSTYTFVVESDNGRAELIMRASQFGLQDRFVGGLRIKQIISEDGINPANNIIKNYTYQDPAHPGITSGILLSEPLYGWGYAPTGNTTGTTCILNFSSVPIAPLSDFDGHHIAYNHVKEDHNGNGYITRKYLVSLDPDFYLSLGGGWLNTPIPFQQRKGLIEEEKTFKQGGTMLASTLSTYKGETESNVQGGMMKALSINCGSTGLIFYRTYTMSKVRKSRLLSQVSTLDDVATSVTLDYGDVIAPPLSTSTTHSDNSVYHNVMTYPYQKSGTEVYDTMVSLNLITPIINTTRVGSDIQTAAKIDRVGTDYNFFNSNKIPYPQKYYRDEVTWNGTTIDSSKNDVTQSTVNSIDALSGLPSQVTIDGWKPINYTWEPNGLQITMTFESFTTYYNYHTDTRLLKSVINVDNTATTYTYDQLFRLKTAKDSCRNVTTTLDYNYGTPSTGGNYVKSTTDYTQATANANSNLTSITNKQFFDGLGRPIQTIKEDQGPTSNDDVIIKVSYDKQGRILYQYEPKSASGNNGAFYTSTITDYSTTAYEASPLNRPISQTHTAWNYPTTTTYGANTTSINGYDPDELFKQTVIDADSKETITYTDTRGRTIATQMAGSGGSNPLTTLYNYDDKDRPIRIIPPGSTTGTTGLNFTYTYYGNDLVKTKKVPDADEVEYRYNNRDLLISYQDGFLKDRSNYKWINTQYDDYGHAIKTGFGNAITNNQSGTPSIIATNILTESTYYTSGNHIDKLEKSYTRELKSDGSLGHTLESNFTYDDCGRIQTDKAHTLLSTTTVDNRTHSYTYDGADNLLEDDHQQIGYGVTHNIDATRTVDFAGRPDEVIFEFAGLTETLSKISYTAKDRIGQLKLGNVTSSSALQLVDYIYKGNGWLERINNSNLGGGDLFYQELKYDNLLSGSGGTVQYNGNIAEIYHRVKNQDISTYSYIYDDYNRLKSARSQDYISGSFTNQDRFNTAYSYDDRGNIMTLTRNGQYQSGTTFMNGQIDNLDYDYITNTNKLETITDGATATLKNRGAKGSSNQYAYDNNGNLTTDPARGSIIHYNHLNLPRLVDFGDGRQIGFTYDASGTQLRKEVKQGTEVLEDRYYIGAAEYKDSALVQVMHDHGRIARKQPCDQNQFIGGILDDAQIYHGDHIISNSSVVPNGTTTFKADESITMNEEFTVTNGKVYEAFIVEPCDSKNWQFEYALKDHLGNTRVVFADVDDKGSISDDEILQVSAYYPFGMMQEGAWENTPKHDYNYQYNGKELHKDFDLDWSNYGARFYDAAIARWTSVDKLAEKYAPISSFAYVANMPTIAIDPDGERIYFVAGAGNDQVGWGYTQRFNQIATQSGLKGFKSLNVSSSSPFMSKNVLPINDMLYSGNSRSSVAGRESGNLAITETQKTPHRRVREQIMKDINSNPLEEGEQLNLSGYSFGSVAVAQAAIQLADDGIMIDNLILIGSPVSVGSELYGKLLEYQESGKIGQIIRNDIEGDLLSNPTDILEFLQGGVQNSGVDGPHFDLARPGKETNERIKQVIIQWLNKGVE